MAAPKTLPEPNRNDPLSEPNVGRRIWAAYLQRGWTRAEFVEKLGLGRYATAVGWDNGATPELRWLVKAAGLVGYTVEDLYYGHHKPAPGVRRGEPSLTDDGVLAQLDALGASPDERAALGELRALPAWRYQQCTPTFVRRFTEHYRSARLAGASHARARVDAAAAAKHDDLHNEAAAVGVKLVSAAQLAQRGAEVQAAASLRRKR